ncbi:hypothetical protein L3X38_037628 [Prunus dulcis]|uniref:Uncharacterized protein n=1 Tax=Prunus dulcis TaxID=3755 RepID=A0AAD4V518_PRUDU|nr:hypothetical protein L3X38_037628 [Prunus dulcis]
MPLIVGMLRLRVPMAGLSVLVWLIDQHMTCVLIRRKVAKHLWLIIKFPESREVEVLVISPVKKEIGLAFKGSQKNVVEALESRKEKEAFALKADL